MWTHYNGIQGNKTENDIIDILYHELGGDYTVGASDGNDLDWYITGLLSESSFYISSACKSSMLDLEWEILCWIIIRTNYPYLIKLESLLHVINPLKARYNRPHTNCFTSY